MKVTCISSFWNANFRFCVSAAVAIVFGLLSMVEKPAALQILVCAVRTVAVIFALSYVARTWFSLNQAFLGLWSGAAALCTRRYRMLKKIRQWIKIGIGVVKPLPAPVFYMVFCFANHRTQEELETCCIVAVIATVAWIFLEWETLIENYACSLRQEADDAEDRLLNLSGVVQIRAGELFFFCVQNPPFDGQGIGRLHRRGIAQDIVEQLLVRRGAVKAAHAPAAADQFRCVHKIFPLVLPF